MQEAGALTAQKYCVEIRPCSNRSPPGQRGVGIIHDMGHGRGACAERLEAWERAGPVSLRKSKGASRGYISMGWLEKEFTDVWGLEWGRKQE